LLAFTFALASHVTVQIFRYFLLTLDTLLAIVNDMEETPMTAYQMDRFNDLQKQGFMKPRKLKMTTMFQVWLPNEEGMAHEGKDEMTAKLLAMKYGATVKKIRRAA
jgi:hypothetical protein